MTHPHTSRLKMPTLRQRGHFYSIPRSIRNRLEERGNRASQESPGSIEVRDHTSMGTRRRPPRLHSGGAGCLKGKLYRLGAHLPHRQTPPREKPPGPQQGLGQPQPSPGLQEIDRLPSPIVAYPPAEKAASFFFHPKSAPFYLQLYKKVLCLVIIFHPKRSRLTIIGYKGAVT